MLKTSSKRLAGLMLAVAATALSTSAYGQAGAAAPGQAPAMPPEVQLELVYIQALQEANMADYAELVIKDFEVKYPKWKPFVKVAKLEQILRQGKFDEADAMIKAEPNPESPDVWMMTLTTADYYYAFGKYEEAKAIYAKFFEKYKAGAPADIQQFYIASLYKYTQMLLFLNDQKGALARYEQLLGTQGIDENTKRQATFEAAQLQVRLAESITDAKERDQIFASAQKKIESLLWSQDLWYARSLVLMAHISVLKGDIDRASKLLDQYMPQLKAIDAQLRRQGDDVGEDWSNLSPIAESRFLMAVMMHDEAKKIVANEAATRDDLKKAAELLSKALSDFVNVYVLYPNTAWAPDALSRSEEIQDLLKSKFGVKEIKIDVTDQQRREIALKQFANARILYNQSQYEKAIAAYEVVLGQFPEVVPDSIMAVSELARCYIEMGDTQQDPEVKQYCELAAETVTGHLAERFSKMGSEAVAVAGDELRRIAGVYSERKNTGMYDATYSLFFKNYPEHTLAATMLMQFANDKFKAEDYLGAIKYYTMVMDYYAKAPQSFPAMLRLADGYSKIGETAKEIEVRTEYVKRVSARPKPGQDLVTGTYMLVRMNRNETLKELRAANALINELRRSGSADAASTNAATAVEAAPAADDGAPPAADGEAAVALSPAEQMDEAMKQVAAANQKLVRAVNDFGKLITMLSRAETRKQYESNERDREINNNILQGALFDRGYTLSQITQPADKLDTFKASAIQSYEAFLKAFPKASGVPTVLMQLGTLYSTMKTDDPKKQEANMKSADEMFSRLAKEHPESEEAKNALYMRGRTLLELGFRQEGVDVLKKMFDSSSAGTYSASQLYQAAQELLSAKEIDQARQGFEMAIKAANNEPSIVIPATLGLAKIMVEQKKYTDAVSALDKFIVDNPKSYAILEANDLLAQAATFAAYEEPDENKRVQLFNRSFNALMLLDQYLTGPKNRAETIIKRGRLLETRVDVEKKFDNKNQADKFLAEATVHYQRFTMSADKQDASVLPSLEIAYFRLVRLLLQMKVYADGTPVYEDVKEECQSYLALFPNGANANAMRAALTEAEIGMATGAR